jgi:peroxiredoxin
VAVSVDDESTSRSLAAALGLRFPIVSDEHRALIHRYGVFDAENDLAWPAIFVIGRDGRIAWRSLAESKSKRAGADEVLAALDRASKAALKP